MSFTGLSQIISIIINPVILIGGVLVLIGMIFLGIKGNDLYNKADEKTYGTKTRMSVNRKTLARKQRDVATRNIEDVDELWEEFNKLSSSYLSWSHMIPIFPLLGILGTVAGLIIQADAMEADVILSGLNTALSSTLLGTIIAIVLKVVEAVFTLRKVTDVEFLLNDQERKYDDAVKMGNFEE